MLDITCPPRLKKPNIGPQQPVMIATHSSLGFPPTNLGQDHYLTEEELVSDDVSTHRQVRSRSGSLTSTSSLFRDSEFIRSLTRRSPSSLNDDRLYGQMSQLSASSTSVVPSDLEPAIFEPREQSLGAEMPIPTDHESRRRKSRKFHTPRIPVDNTRAAPADLHGAIADISQSASETAVRIVHARRKGDTEGFDVNSARIPYCKMRC
jgi:hypothetical protein